MSKHLNLTPLVFRGKDGELLHSPCALFKSSIRQESDADYWVIESHRGELYRAFEKLVTHYSTVHCHEALTAKNPKWKREWILTHSDEIGFINLPYKDAEIGFQRFDIIDDWNGRMPLFNIEEGVMDGYREVYRCTPPGGDIPEGLFSDEELNYPNKCARAKPINEPEAHELGWTVDEDDEDDEDDEEINNLKEQIIQLQESNNEIKSILQHLLKSSNVNNNITYNIQDNAITGSIDIDENSD